jgi:hypothetical protein
LIYRENPHRPDHYWRNDMLIQVRLAMTNGQPLPADAGWEPLLADEGWRHGGRDVFFVPYDMGTHHVRYFCIADDPHTLDAWGRYVIVDDDEPLINARGEEKLVRDFVQALAAYDALIGDEA